MRSISELSEKTERTGKAEKTEMTTRTDYDVKAASESWWVFPGEELGRRVKQSEHWQHLFLVYPMQSK